MGCAVVFRAEEEKEHTSELLSGEERHVSCFLSTSSLCQGKASGGGEQRSDETSSSLIDRIVSRNCPMPMDSSLPIIPCTSFSSVLASFFLVCKIRSSVHFRDDRCRSSRFQITTNLPPPGSSLELFSESSQTFRPVRARLELNTSDQLHDKQPDKPLWVISINVQFARTASMF